MTRLILALTAAALLTPACAPPPPEAASPDTVFVPDTVVVTREIAPPLPEGRQASLCLANGQNVDIRIAPAGDTLIGARRVRLVDLGPGVGFMGDYAADEAWFVNDQAITFERRQFRKFGQAEARECRSIKIVGDHDGVNLFADVSASSPFSTLYVPVRPGIFQAYRSGVGQVRG